MLVSDEGCVAEQTILKFRNNSIVELLGSEWYGIMLYSPNGKIFIDSCADVSGVGTERVLSFVKKHVTASFLMDGEADTFYEQDNYLFAYPIRQTENHYFVFFVFYKTSGPFQERDLRWYKLYAQTALQRLLLENELIQDKNYLDNIMRTSRQPIAVINADYKVVSANSLADAIYQDSLTTNDCIENLQDLCKAVDDVIFNVRDLSIKVIQKNGFRGRVSLSPLKNSKNVVVAVVAVGGGDVLDE